MNQEMSQVRIESTWYMLHSIRNLHPKNLHQTACQIALQFPSHEVDSSPLPLFTYNILFFRGNLPEKTRHPQSHKNGRNWVFQLGQLSSYRTVDCPTRGPQHVFPSSGTPFFNQRYADVLVTIVSIRTRSTQVIYAGIIFDTKSLQLLSDLKQTRLSPNIAGKCRSFRRWASCSALKWNLVSTNIKQRTWISKTKLNVEISHDWNHKLVTNCLANTNQI